MIWVQGEDGHNDLNLIAQAAHERRAQRPVDEATGQDGVFTWTSLATEERTGDTSGGVHALLDIDRKREEVEMLLGLLRSSRRAEQHGLVVKVRNDRSAGLKCKPTSFETDGAGAEAAVVEHSFGRGDLRSLHGVLLCETWGTRYCVVVRSSIETHGLRVCVSGDHYRGPASAGTPRVNDYRRKPRRSMSVR